VDEDNLNSVDSQLASNPALQKVIQLGYEIKHKRENNRPFLRIEAFHGGRTVGFLCVEIVPALGQIHAENILVMPEHRRKGLADAMMVCAEQLTGLVIVRAANQTDEGRALWNRPNRPWGNTTNEFRKLA
jgi:GNAT superfamily N-acetyltransferase